MNDEKWQEIIGEIKEKFGIENQGKEELEGGGSKEWIEFNGRQGKMRLERTVKPKVLDVKTVYSKRAGTSAKIVKPVVSKTETVQFVKAYLWKDGSWEEIQMPGVS